MTKKLAAWTPVLINCVYFLAAIFLAAYFLHFAAGALRAHFSLDDITNLGRYYERDPRQVALDMADLSPDTYRPAGEVFYLAIYRAAGLNPLPFRFVILALIAANIYFTWQIARWITDSRAAAFLAAMLACAHANMVAIYYWGSTIYDTLAYFFTALALVVYIGGRRNEHAISIPRAIAIVLVFCAAINAKEVAIVAAVWIVGYELLVPKARKWLVPAMVLAVAAMFTGLRVFGPGSLSDVRGYEIDPRLARFVENNTLYLNDLFYTQFFSNGARLAMAWLAITGLAMILGRLSRDRRIWWCWLLVSTATLPTAFTLVPRNGSSLYLALLPWALLIAVFFAAITTQVTAAIARLASAEPHGISGGLEKSGVGSFSRRRELIEWTAAFLIAAMVAFHTAMLWGETTPGYINVERPIWSAIEQIRAIRPVPAAKSRVIFLKQPLPDWTVYFIARLAWRDKSIEIRLSDKMDNPPADADLGQYDLVLSFEDGDLRVARRRLD